MKALFLVALFIIGTCFGSFLCCQARRYHQKTEKPKNKFKNKRSICMHCHYQLKWYDNIPLFSWLFLKGKCRKCHKPIGLAEILSEFLVGLAFLGIATTVDFATTTVLGWCIFAITLILILFLSFLAIYDGIYGKLPSKFLYISIAIGAVLLALKEADLIIASGFMPELIWRPIVSALILGGIYLILHLISKGKWVGDGDWLLGLAIGFALYDPWLALIVLFVANLLAFLVMVPFIKKNKSHQIHFGPFMVIAFVIAITFSDFFFYAMSGLSLMY